MGDFRTTNIGIKIAKNNAKHFIVQLTDKSKKLGDYRMLAYEFYWVDKTEESHFIGILPERRKKPKRISKESILNRGKLR